MCKFIGLQPIMEAHSKTHLMVKVAKQYFEEGMNQREIATSLRISRSTISRLLSRARLEGIVQTTIEVPPEIHPETERALEKEYKLKDKPQPTKEYIGKIKRYFEESGLEIGIGG